MSIVVAVQYAQHVPKDPESEVGVRATRRASPSADQTSEKRRVGEPAIRVRAEKRGDRARQPSLERTDPEQDAAENDRACPADRHECPRAHVTYPWRRTGGDRDEQGCLHTDRGNEKSRPKLEQSHDNDLRRARWYD